MWQHTFAAILDFSAFFIFNIAAVSAAVIYKIQRTKTKQAVYFVGFVTRIVFTRAVFKISVAHFYSTYSLTLKLTPHSSAILRQASISSGEIISTTENTTSET